MQYPITVYLYYKKNQYFSPYLERLIETLHHTDPLRSLFGELARLNLKSLHLMVQFTLIYISLSNT